MAYPATGEQALRMQRYIAFLSGLPVGGESVTPQTLRSLFLKLGFVEVEAHGTTGNVAFDTAPVGVTAALEAQISRHLKRFVHGDIWTFIRSRQEVERIIRDAPPCDTAGSTVFVVFLAEPLDDKAARRIRANHSTADSLYPAGREIYWVRRVTADGGSPLSLIDFIDGPVTLRSLTTLKGVLTRQPRRAVLEAPPITESERSRQ